MIIFFFKISSIIFSNCLFLSWNIASLYIDIIISTYADPLTTLKRDYENSLAIEERHFLNYNNLEEYNNSLLNMYNLIVDNDINIMLYDTSYSNQRDLSFDVSNKILNDMKNKYLVKVKNMDEHIKK